MLINQCGQCVVCQGQLLVDAGQLQARLGQTALGLAQCQRGVQACVMAGLHQGQGLLTLCQYLMGHRTLLIQPNPGQVGLGHLGTQPHAGGLGIGLGSALGAQGCLQCGLVFAKKSSSQLAAS